MPLLCCPGQICFSHNPAEPREGLKAQLCCPQLHLLFSNSQPLCPAFGKGVRQGCILSSCLFNLYAEYIMPNARLDEVQAGIKIAERNISNLRYADDTTLMAESEEELKSLLIKESGRGEWKSWLKTQNSNNEDHGIQSHHIVANRWENNGNSDRLCFWGLQNHYRWWLQARN